jgi:hypothetical protein
MLKSDSFAYDEYDITVYVMNEQREELWSKTGKAIFLYVRICTT